MLVPNIDRIYPARKKEEAGPGSVCGYIPVHLHNNGTLKRGQTAHAQKERIVKASVYLRELQLSCKVSVHLV